ncbi:hypothetical protein F4553_007722 [Allocatelliglobosispora scoriae]|uniref:Uncharacterized protein n=1 Tax=Allocatelliglobosispora scoriae TaxID=643052 RepID=A0A841C3E4_9ACTN|nr:hypothetical protein [Allocatelliglobosispora scoriae]MBB5874288.1 hypothetical protein [Allocatelliglobosispora scoriae]
MTVEYARDLDVAQGYDSTPATHRPYGRIVGWTIGDSTIAPDITVTDPRPPGSPVTPTGQAVAVLSHVDWSTLPTENIALRGRVSAANARQLRMLAARPLTRTVMSIAVVVYEYDPVTNAYYPSFATFAGTAPGGAVKPGAPGAGGFGSAATPAIYALLGKTSGTELGLTIAQAPSADPVGIVNVELAVTLAPPIAAKPQQIRMQTSPTAKRIQPWGLPQV